MVNLLHREEGILPMRSRPLAPLIICLLVAPVAGAATTVADVHALSIATAGEASLDARLGALKVTEETNDLRWSLHAQQLQVETHVGEAPVVAAGAVGTRTDSHVDEWADATVSLRTWRPSGDIFAVGEARLQMKGSFIRLAVPDTTVLQQKAAIPAEGAGFTYPTDAAIAATGDASAETILSGGFTLVFYDIDFQVDGLHGNGNGTRSYWSGSRMTEPVPDAPAPVGYAQEERVVYVHVKDGTLRLLGRPGAVLAVTPVLQVEGVFEAADVTGAVDGPSGRVTLRSDDLQLKGRLTVTTARDDGGLLAVVEGDPREMTIGGTIVAWPEKSNAPLWPLTPLLLVAAAAAAFLGRRRRIVRRIVRLLDAEDYEGAWLCSQGPMRSPRHRNRVLVPHVVAALRTGHFAEAHAALDAPGWQAPQEGTRRYLRAQAHMMTGRIPEAVEQVKACLREAPEMWPDVESNKVFQPILQDPGVRSHLPGPALRDQAYG